MEITYQFNAGNDNVKTIFTADNASYKKISYINMLGSYVGEDGNWEDGVPNIRVYGTATATNDIIVKGSMQEQWGN